MNENDANNLYERAVGNKASSAVMHVRVMGRSRDIALDLLDVGSHSTDEAVRSAVARFMEIAPAQLTGTVLERHSDGNMTLRPQAVFG